MGPLAAFQVLLLAMAAAMSIEGLKPSHPARTRVIFWTLFTFTALIGILTNRIAGAWPAASSAMVRVGSHPILLILIILLIAALPSWSYSRGWGYGPSGILGLVLIALMVLIQLGRL